jgi:hypothetical protein
MLVLAFIAGAMQWHKLIKDRSLSSVRVTVYGFLWTAYFFLFFGVLLYAGGFWTGGAK